MAFVTRPLPYVSVSGVSLPVDREKMAKLIRPLWHVAIFCWNEVERIAACIAAVDRAIGDRSGRITVIVNGSTDGSAEAAWDALCKIDRYGVVLELALGDKADAINHFLYSFGTEAPTGLNFFIDGYVTILPGALAELAMAMSNHPEAHAASGFAVNGRSEAAANHLAVGGGRLRGALYCLRPAFIQRMIKGGLSLPVGLYRGDGLLGNMVCHDLDPVNKPWNSNLCLSVPEATYEIYSLSPWRPSHYRRHFRRKVRQMRGKLENAAIAAIVPKLGFAALPRDCNVMIRDYVRVHGLPRVSLADKPFLWLALIGAQR